MRVDLFAGLPVTDYTRSAKWYERFLGSEPSFLPTATEAVWELAEHRFVFIEERPQDAGHAMHTPSSWTTSTHSSGKSPAEASSLPGARPTPTASERRRIEIPTAMRSASVVPRCPPATSRR